MYTVQLCWEQSVNLETGSCKYHYWKQVRESGYCWIICNLLKTSQIKSCNTLLLFVRENYDQLCKYKDTCILKQSCGKWVICLKLELSQTGIYISFYQSCIAVCYNVHCLKVLTQSMCLHRLQTCLTGRLSVIIITFLADAIT